MVRYVRVNRGICDRMWYGKLTVSSPYGIGSGRIPYDVNAALIPAALRSIVALFAAGFSPEHPGWNETASAYAQGREDSILEFFTVTPFQRTKHAVLLNPTPKRPASVFLRMPTTSPQT